MAGYYDFGLDQEFMNQGTSSGYGSKSRDTAASSKPAGAGGGVDPVQAGMAGGAAGGPWGAAAGVAGSFLMNYLNQRAQEEENRKQAMKEAAQYQGTETSNALRSLGQMYGQALR